MDGSAQNFKLMRVQKVPETKGVYKNPILLLYARNDCYREVLQIVMKKKFIIVTIN
jgi:hypothetical protein